MSSTTPKFKKGDILRLRGYESHKIKIDIVYDQDGEGIHYYRDDSPMRHLHSEDWLVENYEVCDE